MRTWYKYYLDPKCSGINHVSRDREFEHHERAIGGYHPDGAYGSKKEFFEKYFYNYHRGRLEYYDLFLRKHPKTSDKILSIASGRCANELYLSEAGYRITCSDLKKIAAYDKTRDLFSGFKFIELDILKKAMDKKFDAIMCLSLIYLFDDEKLSRFFLNVRKSLKPGGCLILDSSGPPDNFRSYFLHDIFLKYERVLLRFLKCLVTGSLDGYIIKDFGYRRTNAEIINTAKKSGLHFKCMDNYAFKHDFMRSPILRNIIQMHAIIEKTFDIFGKGIPYIRMFRFQKV